MPLEREGFLCKGYLLHCDNIHLLPTLALARRGTDVAQASLGLVGLLTAAAWMMNNRDPMYPQPSVGFPGYLYPDDATCDMYNGVPAVETEGACMYNKNEWGSDGVDNGAYPFGDKKVTREDNVYRGPYTY